MTRTGAVAFVAIVAALALPPVEASGQPPSSHGRSAPERFGLHLGNEGVLVSLGTDWVLIDGLYREGVDGYRTVPETLLLDRKFMGVGVVLATHHHADHFDAATVLAHLAANPGNHFVSTPDAVDRLHALEPAGAVRSRIRASYPVEGERERFELGRFGLETLNLHHGRGRGIQNIGHLVTGGGLSLLHRGDTEVTVDEILEQGIVDDSLDLAFVPYWLLLGADGPAVIEALGARRVFAIHLPLPDVDDSWWGDQGSLAGTIEALERLDRVAVLYEPGTRFELTDEGPDS